MLLRVIELGWIVRRSRAEIIPKELHSSLPVSSLTPFAIQRHKKIDTCPDPLRQSKSCRRSVSFQSHGDLGDGTKANAAPVPEPFPHVKCKPVKLQDRSHGDAT